MKAHSTNPIATPIIDYLMIKLIQKAKSLQSHSGKGGETYEKSDK